MMKRSDRDVCTTELFSPNDKYINAMNVPDPNDTLAGGAGLPPAACPPALLLLLPLLLPLSPAAATAGPAGCFTVTRHAALIADLYSTQ